jgi:hypothetical protein
MNRFAVVRHALLAFWVGVVGSAAWAQPDHSPSAVEPESAAVSTPHVYAQLMLLHSDLDQIRFEMGKPKPTPGAIDIANVAPREVFFQVLTLFEKANRLSFEHTREIAEEPPLAEDPITPSDVIRVVEAALERINHVKQQIGISQLSSPPPLDPSKTPTDVLIAALAASRQLNLLLAQQFSPAEVYEQLTLAVGYTARLRARFPGDRLPETPPYVRGKQPTDVGRKLFDCLRLIERIAARSDLQMLTLRSNEENLMQVTPSDVYDMATLLVSELAYLWAQLDDVAIPRPVYYPGRRFPSHVYQRAELLERQLSELAALVDSAPSWLKSP